MGQMTFNLQLFLFVPWRHVDRAVKWRAVCLCLINSTSATGGSGNEFCSRESVSHQKEKLDGVELTKLCTDFFRAEGFSTLTSKVTPQNRSLRVMGLLRALRNPLEDTCPCLYEGRNSLPCLTISTYSLQGKRWKKRRRPSQPTPVVWPREAFVREYVRSTGFVEAHVGQQARR
jgi:hypothetical protein